MITSTGLISNADWLPFLAELAAKSTVVLLLAAAAAALLWRASAATRHLVWCVGIMAVLALPLFSLVLPAWEVPLLPAPAAAAHPVQLGAGEPASLEMPVGRSLSQLAPAPRAAEVAATGAWLPRVAAGLVLTGVAAGLLWLMVGFWGVARLGRRAEVVRDPEWLRTSHEAAEQLGLRRPVLLLRARGSVMPATGGLLWPVIVVPDVAEQWTDDRRRAVLAHELAHVKRFDCLTQALAQVACALFWWHPAVWYAARRLRVERERACDDLVLGAGTRASDYAAHLLEIARSHRGLRLATPALVSMARPSHLESRLLWVLDAARSRGVPSARATVLSVLSALLVAGSLSALRPINAAAQADGPVAATAAEAARAARIAKGEADRAETEAERAQEHAREAAGEAALAAMRAGAAGMDTFPEVDDLIAMRAVGVDAAYIAEMRAAGFADLDIDELVALKAVGVTREYVAQMNGAGLGPLDAEDITSMRAMGVTPAYVDELRRRGFTDVSAETVVGMKAMNVDAEFVQSMASAGYRDLELEELMGMRAVGVTPEYIREMRDAGIRDLDAETLTSLRALDVDAAYIRELATVGLTGLSAERLTELRAHGIDASYVRELRAAGFSSELTADQLVRLRVSGVDRDLVRSRAP